MPFTIHIGYLVDNTKQICTVVNVKLDDLLFFLQNLAFSFALKYLFFRSLRTLRGMFVLNILINLNPTHGGNIHISFLFVFHGQRWFILKLIFFHIIFFKLNN
jgi:hypothetical protein